MWEAWLRVMAVSADLVGKRDEPEQRCGRQRLEGCLQGTPDQLQVLFTAAEVHQGKEHCLACHLWDAGWVLQAHTPTQRCGLEAGMLGVLPFGYSPCNTVPGRATRDWLK